MWVSTKKQYENSLMFFQFLQKDDLCIFNFTNMKKLYSKEIYKTSIASLYSTTNDIVEVESTDVVDLLLKETKNIEFNFFPENLNLRAHIIVKLTEGFSPLILKLKLDFKDPNYFYSNLTCPLLQIIQVLKKNQEDLFELLKKKDLEISEYVLEGGNINRNIQTETFDKDKFLINTFQKHTDLSDDSPSLFELYSSPLLEPFEHRCLNVRELLNNKPVNKVEENKEISKKKKYVDQTSSSTQIEINRESINVKKKKPSLLKNL
ncbi:XLF family [Cinara cedri]|uniref:XLF family n=1 Tax=Cinara cedri TaxID=506608 RepID=A0A5E4NHH2_9HEMI|nr:XLF family [Cinara cedri]